MTRIGIILGSTRPGRIGEAVANWVYEVAKKRNDAEFELVDVKDFELPLLDELAPPSLGKYSQLHTKTWAAKILTFDAYVFEMIGDVIAWGGALKSLRRSSAKKRVTSGWSMGCKACRAEPL